MRICKIISPYEIDLKDIYWNLLEGQKDTIKVFYGPQGTGNLFWGSYIVNSNRYSLDDVAKLLKYRSQQDHKFVVVFITEKTEDNISDIEEMLSNLYYTDGKTEKGYDEYFYGAYLLCVQKRD